jgi:hypothetical protein
MSGEGERAEIQTRDHTEYLRGRIEQIRDDLNPKMLEAQATWPKGSNGPIAIAAYEALAERVRRAVFSINYLLMMTDTRHLVVDDPEAAARLREIVERRRV